ncbi:FGGY-family carbohydrate kinase [Psychrobacillus antarcticus]|uniref:FGGY-family carbohydrate kinase n=1 Tax=Psychrobacillus antarcticus TaxID=2879115 RepID=UPI00240891DF|nr:FGGY-family carbohydrate kinase [Psychrobacillus antarcticus]
MEKFLLGIDIGTTSTKLALINTSGNIITSISKEVHLISPQPGWAEEDPHSWWENVKFLIPEILIKSLLYPEQIAAVGVSGMVPTLICLDEKGNPLRNSIQQNDTRAWKEIEELKVITSHLDILEDTGSEITQQSIAPKIMWLQKNEPNILAQTKSICGSYEFITRKLTGNTIKYNENNWALESGLFNFNNRTWHNELLHIANIKSEWLSQTYGSHEIIGCIQGSHETCLIEGTPIVAGAADHVASAFSAGLINDGDMLIKLGGAGDILITSQTPVRDKRLYLDYHLIPGLYLPNGCMASSGSLIKWFQNELTNKTALDDLEAEAQKTSSGSDGLITLPYFLGEKTPLNNPKARGMVIGLHLGHTRGHIYRSILEGIGFGFYHHIEVFKELGLQLNKIRITNGGSKSKLWRQIIADITGLELESIIEHPGSSLGAAFIAGMGSGEIQEWSDIHKYIKIEETIFPDSNKYDGYQKLYKIYRSSYEKLIEEQEMLSNFSLH